MQLVYKFYIKSNDELYRLCVISKNLYNQALYTIKQELKNSGKWLNYYDLYKIMLTMTNLEGEINCRLLKAQVAQQNLKNLCNNISSYIKSIKDWSKNKEKYRSKPNFPNYKDKVNILIFTNQDSRIRKGQLILSKNIRIKIPQYEKYAERLKKYQQTRIIPKIDKSFEVELIYNQENVINEDLNKNLYSSIDLGVDNLATLVLPNQNPVLFNGRPIKSINQYFNKTISKLQSELTNNQRTSKRIKRLWYKRENQMRDAFHKVSRKIVNLLIENKVGNLVVGYNKGWKDSINIGKRNNQTFVGIPYLKLIDYLKYKCKMVGINLIINEESYTSKCDSLALESIEKHESYLGKRVKRGLFQSLTNKLINADVNGALNILRKVIDDSYVNRIINSGWLFRPIRVNVYNKIHLSL